MAAAPAGVLSTFAHSDSILEIHVAGATERIESSISHVFDSADRRGWVIARELRVRRPHANADGRNADHCDRTQPVQHLPSPAFSRRVRRLAIGAVLFACLDIEVEQIICITSQARTHLSQRIQAA